MAICFCSNKFFKSFKCFSLYCNIPEGFIKLLALLCFKRDGTFNLSSPLPITNQWVGTLEKTASVMDKIVGKIHFICTTKLNYIILTLSQKPTKKAKSKLQTLAVYVPHHPESVGHQQFGHQRKCPLMKQVHFGGPRPSPNSPAFCSNPCLSNGP